MVTAASILGDLVDGPVERGSQGLSQYGATGFADGRQLAGCPFFRTVLLELDHEQSVREHDQVHVPGLALAVTQLTISHAKLLLPVPMKGLRACPAIAIDLQNPNHFPSYAVGYQHLTRLAIPLLVPDDHDPHLVVDVRDADGRRKIPLLLATAMKRLATVGIDFRGHFLGLQFAALPPNLPIELQVAHVTSRTAEPVSFAVNVVERLGVGEVART